MQSREQRSAGGIKRPRLSQDVVLGLIFSAIAVTFLAQMQDLPLGSLKRVGPGLLPAIVSWALLLIGLAHIARGLRPAGADSGRSVEAMGPWGMRGILGIGAALGFFGVAMAWNAGLLVAGSGTVLLGSIATGQGTMMQRAALVASVVGGSTVLFCILLGLPIPILPQAGL